MPHRTQDESLCSSLLHPVSQRVLPGSDEERRTTAGSGQRLYASYMRYAQPGAASRTFMVSLLFSMEAWSSSVCVLRWKRKVTKSKRWLFQLAVSVPRIGAIEYGLWPTPTTQDAHNNGAESQQRRNTRPLNAVMGGSLNVNFVEAMMGYPQNWTALDKDGEAEPGKTEFPQPQSASLIARTD